MITSHNFTQSKKLFDHFSESPRLSQSYHNFLWSITKLQPSREASHVKTCVLAKCTNFRRSVLGRLCSQLKICDQIHFFVIQAWSKRCSHEFLPFEFEFKGQKSALNFHRDNIQKYVAECPQNWSTQNLIQFWKNL